jgi:small subunit ribosomal protein S4
MSSIRNKYFWFGQVRQNPGMHGKGRFSKKSEYGKQLMEKQKMRFTFGITEKQCRNYYTEAARRPGDTGFILLQLLELRIDNVLFRSGIATTRMQARQMISHGNFMLNGQRVTVPSITVKPGDVIQVREKMKKSTLYSDPEKSKYTPPSWLKVDAKAKQIEVERLPAEDDVERMIEKQLIVEFYSK